jgi:hypothetical protein
MPANQSAFSKEFIDAVTEVHRLHGMKLRWLVPPVKSLSVGQGYRPVPNKKVTISGFNTTHFKKAPWNINPNNKNQAGENIYRIEVNLISPMEYLRLPSHLAEMARVDKIVALCKGKRDDINGVDGAFTSGSGNHLVLKDSVSRPGEPEVETARTFVGCWSNRDRWSNLNAEYWDLWMHAQNNVMDYYIDGSTTDYADGLRGNRYWNWPIKFNAITGKMYYNPKINPRSTNEVEAIITDLVTGKIMDEGEYNMGIPGAGRMPALSGVSGLVDNQSWRPTLARPTLEEVKLPPELRVSTLPTAVPPKNPNKGIAKPKKKAPVNRNKTAPISKLKKKK